MDAKVLTDEIEQIVQECDVFLSTKDFSDEQKQELVKTPSNLQIKAFNTIVNECKEEAQGASFERMSGVMKLLYDIEIKPFYPKRISKHLHKFLGEKLYPKNLSISETNIEDMICIVKNIEQVCHGILNYVQEKNHKAMDSQKVDELKEALAKLVDLKQKIEYQIEHDAKKIADNIVDDFYNVYIFFTYILRMCMLKNQQLLSVELASFLDRYINVINYTFSKRHLKSQDMIYYYVAYELNELQLKIYKYLDE